jgi:hypothetical protein
MIYPEGVLGERCKVVVYAAAALREMADLGMLTGPVQCTPLGIAEADQLRASGFDPSDEDLAKAFVCLRVPPNEIHGVMALWKNRDRIPQKDE